MYVIYYYKKYFSMNRLLIVLTFYDYVKNNRLINEKMNLELIAEVFLSTICQVRKHIPLCLPYKVPKVCFEMKK